MFLFYIHYNLDVEPLADFRVERAEPSSRQLAAHLRRALADGRLAPGTRLPTTAELARRNGMTINAVQAALAPLVREGRLERRAGFGTVVRAAPGPLAAVALYAPRSLDIYGSDRFAALVQRHLLRLLGEAGIAARVWEDARPRKLRAHPLPMLASHARRRLTEVVIAVEAEAASEAWLRRLPVNTVFNHADAGAAETWNDYRSFAALGIAHLARQGCRSVGLVTVVPPGPANVSLPLSPPNDLHHAFAAAAARAGLAVGRKWIRFPQAADPRDGREGEAERFGRAQAEALAAAGDLPDGLLVYTDRVAAGVVAGLLARGLTTGRPRLALHRNTGMDYPCPLPAAFIEYDPAAVAAALLGLARRLHAGEPAAPCLVPYSLVV